MKRPELYHKTVDILVDAYFADTLEHGNCYACAVGNIIAANCNIQYDPYYMARGKLIWKSGRSFWDDVFYTSQSTQSFRIDEYEGNAKYQIDSTGYTVYELAKIEYAFETADKGKSEDEWMFNGLMAVVDVLDEIHENTDEEITLKVKSEFKTCKL